LIKWNANTIFLITREKRILRRPRCRGVKKIKMNPWKIGWGGRAWGWDQWRAFLKS
jgi:hypothetical protein